MQSNGFEKMKKSGRKFHSKNASPKSPAAPEQNDFRNAPKRKHQTLQTSPRRVGMLDAKNAKSPRNHKPGKDRAARKSPRMNDDLNKESVMVHKSEGYNKALDDSLLRKSEMNVINSFDETVNSRVKSLLGDVARQNYQIQS